MFDYQDKNGVSHKGFSYENYKGKEPVTNAEYIILDAKDPEFVRYINLRRTSKWLKSVTSKVINNNNIDLKYIALVSMPSKYADYSLAYLYLGENKDGELNCLHGLLSHCTAEFESFLQQFGRIIVERGYSFDLIGRKGFEYLDGKLEEAEEMCFDVSIGGKKLPVDGTIVVKDCLSSSLFDFWTKKKLEAIGVNEARVHLDLSNFHGFEFWVDFLHPSGNVVSPEQFYGEVREGDELPPNAMDVSLPPTCLPINLKKIKEAASFQPETLCILDEQEMELEER